MLGVLRARSRLLHRILLVQLDDDRSPVTRAQRRLEGFREPLFQVGPQPQPVDHHLERVLRVLREARHRVDLVNLVVDPHADEALGPELDQKLLLLTLAVDDNRRQDHQARIVRQRKRRIDHLRDRHRRELLLRMIGTVGIADTREQQAQVVVDLGDGADRRARIVRSGLLLDRDRRGEPLDQVDVRLLHELQELARVRR